MARMEVRGSRREASAAIADQVNSQTKELP